MKKKIILSLVFSLLVICNALPLHNSNNDLKNEQSVQISHKKIISNKTKKSQTKKEIIPTEKTENKENSLEQDLEENNNTSKIDTPNINQETPSNPKQIQTNETKTNTSTSKSKANQTEQNKEAQNQNENKNSNITTINHLFQKRTFRQMVLVMLLKKNQNKILLHHKSITLQNVIVVIW